MGVPKNLLWIIPSFYGKLVTMKGVLQNQVMEGKNNPICKRKIREKPELY